MAKITQGSNSIVDFENLNAGDIFLDDCGDYWIATTEIDKAVSLYDGEIRKFDANEKAILLNGTIVLENE